MQKIMKPQVIKTIVVRLSNDNISEHVVDTDIFVDDPFMEAATRAIEGIKAKRGAMLRPIIECWDKKFPKRIKLYNSYWILVNAARYTKAELLREKYKMQHHADLATQPVWGENAAPDN